jgi:hypothetical protein
MIKCFWLYDFFSPSMKNWNIKTSFQITIRCSRAFLCIYHNRERVAAGVLLSECSECCTVGRRGLGVSRDLWIMVVTCFVCGITICGRTGAMCCISLASLLVLRYDPWIQTWISPLMFKQGDQKVSVHFKIAAQKKTRKNILSSLNHLPW